MQDSPSTAAHRGRRVAEAGGALKLRHTYRTTCCLMRERARRAGAPAAKIEAARRRAQHAEQICFATWSAHEAVYRAAQAPSTPRPRGAQRQARPRARRAAASSSTSSCDPGDDGPGEPPPPRPRLWRHPRFGLCSPALLRLLVRAQAEEAQR